MADLKTIITEKIHQVIIGAQQFREEQFRMILEGLVKKGGKDAEFLLIRYMNNKDLHHETRANIIRITGYIQNIMYLMPLKKIIDIEPNIKLKRAAILALAKYDDERALNILNTALQTISNPILHKTIHEKINLIRQNHPVLALTPRFLKGKQDIKAHTVALGILKKILTSQDARSFLKYIQNDDPLVGKGVFEILCYRGDESVQEGIFSFFQERCNNSQCFSEPKCDDMYILTASLRHYLENYPALVEPRFEQMKPLFAWTGDSRIKKVFISIFCRSHSQDILAYVKEVYEKEDSLKETIIDATAGNPHAVDFLFEKYNSGKSLKEKVVRSLLRSDQGFDYFLKHFYSFQLDEQEIIVRNLPPSTRPELIKFIGELLQSELHPLKKYLLIEIKNKFLYNFRRFLFQPKLEDEFYSMEEEYLTAIFTVFPAAASRRMLYKLADSELPLPTLKRFLTVLKDAAHKELVLNMPSEDDHKMFLKLTKKIFHINNQEVTDKFLNSMAYFKTFDFRTYRHWNDFINYFIKVKNAEESLTEEDKIGIRQVKENLKLVVEDIRRVENIEKEVKMALLKTVPDLLQLKRLLENNGIALSFRLKGLLSLITDYFRNADEEIVAKWKNFFKGFPLLTRIIREARIKDGQTQAGIAETTGSILEKLRIVVHFQEKELNALFKDQFRELLPDFPLFLDDPHLAQTDILLCDSATLKDYIKRKALNTSRLFVLLKSKEEFNEFKGIQFRSFLEPISVYRVIRLILQELYLMKP